MSDDGFDYEAAIVKLQAEHAAERETLTHEIAELREHCADKHENKDDFARACNEIAELRAKLARAVGWLGTAVNHLEGAARVIASECDIDEDDDNEEREFIANARSFLVDIAKGGGNGE